MPSWENIPQSYKEDVDEYFSDDDGNIYCVPEATVVAPALGYNTEYFDEPPSSWEILWNEDLEGRVTVWDRSYIAGSIAAKVAGQDWRDPDDFDELKELLIQQKSLNNTYWKEYQAGMQMFINEDVVAGMMTMGRLFSARFDHDAPISYVIPEEGTMYSQDQFVIPKGSPNPRVSTQFLNWAAKPENAVKLFTSMGYKPAVNGLESQLQNEGVPQEQIDFISWSDDQQSRMDFQAPFPEEVRTGYDEMWTEVKAA
jgi:spermidine/putrescine transport system substrate-binding protein